MMMIMRMTIQSNFSQESFQIALDKAFATMKRTIMRLKVSIYGTPPTNGTPINENGKTMTTLISS